MRNKTSGQSWPSNTVATDAFYQTVTDRIISSLKAGVIPWAERWKGPRFAGGPFPRNFYTGKPTGESRSFCFGRVSTARSFGAHFGDELYSKAELVAGQALTVSLVLEN